MFFMLLMLLATAFGAPLEQQFTWDLTVDGRPVGERVLKVRYLPANHGMRRLLQSWTDVNANVLGLPYRFQQRLTAHIGEGPASFHSVVVDNKPPARSRVAAPGPAGKSTSPRKAPAKNGTSQPMIWTFLRSTVSILNLGSTCCVTNVSASCPLKPEPFGKGRLCSLVPRKSRSRTSVYASKAWPGAAWVHALSFTSAPTATSFATQPRCWERRLRGA